MTDLTQRQKEILEAVLIEFMAKAGPVGSRTIARKYAFDLSPATIRGEMADLEDRGFLTQPHTSAGRVPTNLGFQYYVKSLMQTRNLSPEDRQEIRRQFQRVRKDLENLLRETSRILSRFSRYTGMVWSPRHQETGVFRSIDFFPVDPRNILALVVYPHGMIRTRMIPMEKKLEPAELVRVSEFLNREFSGLPPEELREKLEQKVKEGIWEFLITEALGLKDAGLDEGEVYVEGQLNIIDLPDFSDRDRLREILRTLEEKRNVIQLLNQTLKQEGMRVFIGMEEMFQELKGVSLVAAVYGAGEAPWGSLGVLGPTRMDYSRIIPLVEYTSQLVSDLLIQN